MNKKALLGIGLATIVLMIVIVWFGKPATGGQPIATYDPNAPKGPLKAEEINFDFGTISMANGNVSHMYAVTNTGTEPITIEKMYTSCMCTTAKITVDGKEYGPFGMPGHGLVPSMNTTIAPGTTATMEAVFDPNAHGPAGVGPISRVVILENNAGKPLEISFTANVIP